MKIKTDNFINENIIKRKAMFIPIVGVAVFMLVGYAAVDKEAPEIVSNRVEVSYGEKFDLNAINITDNQDERDDLIVDIKAGNVNTKQLGTYEVLVSASDSSSNIATKEILVEVVDDKAPEFKVVGVDKDM